MSEFDLVCIGCGPAGERAAVQAACFGKRVAIVEREAGPGGAMVNTGTIASKSLRETALLCSSFRRRPLPGVDLAIDRSLSVGKLMAQRYRVQYQEHERIERSLARTGIKYIRGHGRIEDPHTVTAEALDGTVTRLTTQFILIATGSSPDRPDHIPFEHERVVDPDELLELKQIPGSMLVVGGGVVGCEHACMFAEVGVAVTLVHPHDELLGFIDAECRGHLLRSMSDAGIDLRLNTSIADVTARDEGPVSGYADNGEEFRADVLLWAAGRCSNTDDIGLEKAGITAGDRGLIEVNERYRTRVPSIYAAGDVIGFPALASTSMEQGRLAVCHMFGIEFKSALAENLPFGLYTIPAISVVGLNEHQAAEQGLDYVVGRALYRNNARGRMLGDEQGIMKCLFDRHSRRLLGATITGEAATELIHLAQFMLAQEAGIDELVDACFNYPSLSELYKHAAQDALDAIAEDSARQAAA